AAVTEKQSPRRIGEEPAERIDAIGYGHPGLGAKSAPGACRARVPDLINPGTVLRLRLGLQAARLGPWPRLAGGRHRRSARDHRLGQSLAHRRLAVEQVL